MLAFQGSDGKSKTVSPTNPLPVTGGGGGGGGGGDASAANQTLQLTELQAINADLGGTDDAPAASPTATAGIGALLRLGLQNAATALTNWTTLLGRIPALVNGAVPVAPNVQQGSGAVTASTTRVTLAADGPGVSALGSIAGLSIPAHDHVGLGYTGSNLTTVTYRTGGSGGTIVGTLTLSYSGSTLTSVTRS